MHGVLASKSGTSLASGSVLYTCDVEVLSDTPTGNYRLRMTNLSGTDAGGATAKVSGSDGSIGGGVRPPTNPPDPTPTPPRTNIEIGSVSGVGARLGAPVAARRAADTLSTDTGRLLGKAPLPVGCADAEVDIRAADPTPTLQSGSSGQAGGGSGGCQVSAPATTAAAWPVFGLAAAILLRRKRR